MLLNIDSLAQALLRQTGWVGMLSFEQLYSDFALRIWPCATQNRSSVEVMGDAD